VKESSLKGLVRGRHTFGRADETGSSSLDDPNVIKTLRTPVGEFRLSCGVANADARYFRTTRGNAEVFLSFVGGESGADSATADDETGYAATNSTGPVVVEIRVLKNGSLAVLRVGERRSGTSCLWNWELTTSG
jgi:hypothetical protein